MKVFVEEIEWETDGENVDLPSNVTLELEEEDISEDLEDFVSEKLSETYGFLHNGFQFSLS